MKRVKYENPEGAAPAQGLYSHAARVSAGDLLLSPANSPSRQTAVWSVKTTSLHNSNAFSTISGT